MNTPESPIPLPPPPQPESGFGKNLWTGSGVVIGIEALKCIASLSNRELAEAGTAGMIVSLSLPTWMVIGKIKGWLRDSSS